MSINDPCINSGTLSVKKNDAQLSFCYNVSFVKRKKTNILNMVFSTVSTVSAIQQPDWDVVTRFRSHVCCLLVHTNNTHSAELGEFGYGFVVHLFIAQQFTSTVATFVFITISYQFKSFTHSLLLHYF